MSKYQYLVDLLTDSLEKAETKESKPVLKKWIQFKDVDGNQIHIKRNSIIGIRDMKDSGTVLECENKKFFIEDNYQQVLEKLGI